MVSNHSGVVHSEHTAVFYSGTFAVQAGPCTLTVSGALGGYLAIYDSSGNLQWARPEGVAAPATQQPARAPHHPVLTHKFDANRTGGCSIWQRTLHSYLSRSAAVQRLHKDALHPPV